MNRIKNIAVFISGKGTNAKNIISYYHKSTKIKVKFVFSTKENDDVADFCGQHGVAFFIEKEQSKQSEKQQKLCAATLNRTAHRGVLMLFAPTGTHGLARV